jgi:hypothetical protein
MQKMRMLSRNACAISGNESTKSFRSKKALRTAGQPAELDDHEHDDREEHDRARDRDADVPCGLEGRRGSATRGRPRPLSVSTLSVLLQDGGVRLARQPFV